ncbi:MAG: cell division protein ZapA [Deltaproteobacteria bacterium]|nr:cell division protein ZapA [Deltaproteobacteria bacterium]
MLYVSRIREYGIDWYFIARISVAMVDNKVVVNIFGEEYPITGVTDPSHISRVAEYVDSKMKEAAQASSVQARDKVAILAAMSMASELLERSDLVDLVGQDANSTLDRILTDLNDALADDPPRS